MLSKSRLHTEIKGSPSYIVVRGSGWEGIGWNIVLDWITIKSVQLERDPLRRLLQEYAEVFKDELGTIMPVKATLTVWPSATPRFRRPRPVPCALKPLVEQELDRLEKSGVLERIYHSAWAAPIVTVLKRDRQVRICGDYKVTINPVLDVNQYPLPRPEDLFAGKFFSTLDLSHAYIQILLDDDARQHRGLYQYSRLPFAVASAPSIFQRTMDTILQGMDGVICYLDDILVSGKTEKDHLKISERFYPS